MLSSVALPALRAYLDGQVAYRRGQYSAATAHFERALELDSTFALAGLGLAVSAEWTPMTDWNQFLRARRTAWALRDRLSARDQLFLAAVVGPRVASLAPQREIGHEILTARELAVQVAPERVEAWFELGDWIYHRGQLLGIDNADMQAAAAFDRAMQLDSTFVPLLEHLVDLAARAGDLSRVRRMSRLYFTVATAADHRDYVSWRTASALGDSVALRALRTRMSQVDVQSALRITGAAELEGINLDDAERVLRPAISRAGTTNDRVVAYHRLSVVQRNRGRLSDARVLELRRAQLAPEPVLEAGRALEAALFWDDSVPRGERALRILLETAERSPPATGSDSAIIRAHRVDAYRAARMAMKWSLLRGDTIMTRRLLDIARRAVPMLQRVGEVDSEPTAVVVGEAGLAVLGKRPDARRQLERLDSLAKTGPHEFGGDATLNLVISHLFAFVGNIPRALAATRRVPNQYLSTRCLSAYLRERGRLAVLAGGTDEAIRAYRHYLTLRSGADPELAPHLASVRAELKRLEEGR